MHTPVKPLDGDMEMLFIVDSKKKASSVVACLPPLLRPGADGSSFKPGDLVAK